MVAAANGTFFGGGFHIAPKASIEDGMLDIFLADKMKKSYFLRNIPKVIKGTHENLPEVKIVKSKKFVIESDTTLPVEYDGEILKGAKKLEIKVIPKAIKIIAN